MRCIIHLAFVRRVHALHEYVLECAYYRVGMLQAGDENAG